MKRFFVILVLYLTTLPLICCGEDLHETRLNSGLGSTDAYANVLIGKARENSTSSVQLLKEAMRNSPDLPSVYFELAKASFSPSSTGLFESVSYIIEGITAYSRNFWWAFSLAGSISFSLVISFVCALAIIVMTRFPGDSRLFAHDAAEAKNLLFLLLLLIVFSFISPLLFLAGMLVLLGMYMKTLDRLVVYFFLIFLVCSPLLFKATSFFIHTLSSSRMKAIVAVNESRDNTYALSALKDRDDYPSLFSYALALKREGHYYEAIGVYQRLLQRRPDPKVYVNLGNCYVGLKNMQEAMSAYLKAAAMKPLASVYYNLSQVSRELLDFQKGDEYFRRALLINRDAVVDYRLIYSRNPNRIVIDETLPFSQFWRLSMENIGRDSTFGLSVLPASVLSGAAISLLILSFLLNYGIRERAYRCKRCNTILCPRCEKRLTWGSMCQQCYASIVKLDELEVKERVAKLLSIYEHQKKRRNILKTFSFLMPGVSQIYAGKIVWGLFFLWPFLFFLLLPFINMLLTEGRMLFADGFLTWAAVFFGALIYISSNIITRQRITRGWL
jgi:tetratricopeptide (TPR) repeat protein